jgi:hypothetical protein
MVQQEYQELAGEWDMMAEQIRAFLWSHLRPNTAKAYFIPEKPHSAAHSRMIMFMIELASPGIRAQMGPTAVNRLFADAG